MKGGAGSWKLYAVAVLGIFLVPIGALLARVDGAWFLQWLGLILFYAGIGLVLFLSLPLLVCALVRDFVAGVKKLNSPKLERAVWICVGLWGCMIPAILFNALGLERIVWIFCVGWLAGVVATLPLIIICERKKAPPKPKKNRTKLEKARLWCAWGFLLACTGGILSLVTVVGYVMFLFGLGLVIAWLVLTVLIRRQRREMKKRAVRCTRCERLLLRPEARWWKDQPYCAGCCPHCADQINIIENRR